MAAILSRGYQLSSQFSNKCMHYLVQKGPTSLAQQQILNVSLNWTVIGLDNGLVPILTKEENMKCKFKTSVIKLGRYLNQRSFIRSDQRHQNDIHGKEFLQKIFLLKQMISTLCNLWW